MNFWTGGYTSYKVIVVKECADFDHVQDFVDKITETGKENITIKVDDDRHRMREIEVKYATDFHLHEFIKHVKSRVTGIVKELHIPVDNDSYYVNSEGVVIRHRLSFNKHELTVKSRNGEYNKRDEININLDDNPAYLVEAWLELANYTKELSFAKEVYVIDLEDYQIAYYTVKDTTFKFIEIEYIGNGNDEDEAMKGIGSIAETLGLNDSDSINSSVYDIYKESM